MHVSTENPPLAHKLSTGYLQRMVMPYFALGVALLALVVSSATAAYLLFGPTSANVGSRVSALDADLSDLADRVNQWMRRDQTRKAREAKAAGAAIGADFDGGLPNPNADRKAALRARFNQLRAAK